MMLDNNQQSPTSPWLTSSIFIEFRKFIDTLKYVFKYGLANESIQASTNELHPYEQGRRLDLSMSLTVLLFRRIIKSPNYYI